MGKSGERVALNHDEILALPLLGWPSKLAPVLAL